MTPMKAYRASNPGAPMPRNPVVKAVGSAIGAVISIPSKVKTYRANRDADLFLKAKSFKNSPDYKNPDGTFSNRQAPGGEPTEAYKTKVVAAERMRQMRKKRGLSEMDNNPKSITRVY